MPAIPGIADVDEFLRRHWQKQPLVVRDAFPGFEFQLDGDELAGLACEQGVESRIVVSHRGPRYEVRHGPFDATVFGELGDRDWTLLVQDVDKQLPDFAAFLDRFDAIPAWRVDDLMVSWAADGGSVGPHRDRYDVFLVQASGTRRWMIGEIAGDPALLPGHELEVLAEFRSIEEWVLGPGDMLYLPPGVPHWGVAEGDCMTWSIGFRAPSLPDLLHDFTDRLSGMLSDDDRYADPDLVPEEASGGRISAAAVARVETALADAVSRGRQEFPRWFGELATSPKPWLRCAPAETPIPGDALVRGIRAGDLVMERDSRARLAWISLPDRGLCLCADGASRLVQARHSELLELLCTMRHFPPESLKRYLDDDEAVALLCWLQAAGQLVVEGDE